MATPQAPASRVVLLLCDLQNDIVGSLPEALRVPLLRNCARALRSARARGWRVVHSGVCFRPGYPEVAETNRQFRGIRRARTWLPRRACGPRRRRRRRRRAARVPRLRRRAGILLDGTDGAQFVADVAPEPHEVVRAPAPRSGCPRAARSDAPHSTP